MDFVSLGFVGASESKWQTEQQKLEVKKIIRNIIQEHIFSYGHFNVNIVSGGCPYGGVDTWAVEEAEKLLIPKCNIYEFEPQTLTWEDVIVNGKTMIGYKTRNENIAYASHKLYCFAPKQIGAWCYHCKIDGHVKNGGCWTLKYFRKLKPCNESELFVI